MKHFETPVKKLTDDPGISPLMRNPPVYKNIGEPRRVTRREMWQLVFVVFVIVAIATIFFETLLSAYQSRPAVLTGRQVFPKSMPADLDDEL